MLEACVVFVKTDTSGNCLPQLLIERGGRRGAAQHSFITPIYDRGRAEREREGRGRVRMRGCQNPLRQISAIHLHVKRGGQSEERERVEGGGSRASGVEFLLRNFALISKYSSEGVA